MSAADAPGYASLAERIAKGGGHQGHRMPLCRRRRAPAPPRPAPGRRCTDDQNSHPRRSADSMHHADPERRHRRAAQRLGVGMNVRPLRSRPGALVDVRVGVVHAVVTVRMGVEVALRPAEQEPQGQSYDHHADGNLRRPGTALAEDAGRRSPPAARRPAGWSRDPAPTPSPAARPGVRRRARPTGPGSRPRSGGPGRWRGEAPAERPRQRQRLDANQPSIVQSEHECSSVRPPA